MALEKKTTPEPLAPTPIPNPPGGGSWTWDEAGKQWTPRQTPNQQPEPQE